MAWRAAASVLLVAAILVGHVQASWKWEKNSTHRPASASSVVTSSSSTSTSSSSSVSIGPQHEVLLIPKTGGQPQTSDGQQEGHPTQKFSRALDAGPSDAGTVDLEAAPSDTEPRFIGHLKKKLCSVGLGFNCGPKAHKPAVQHYGKPADPHDIQYVQPVEIRPVGKPIPAIPYIHGTGYGSGHGSGHGNGHGGGHGNGHGDGYGSGHGSGHGNGHGDGYGSGHGSGHGNGHGDGYGNGHGSGHGNGHGDGYGNGHGSGHGNGHGAGYGNGHGGGHGSSHGSGYDNSHGSSHGNGYDDSHSSSFGNSHDGGLGNNHGSSFGNSYGTSFVNSYGSEHGGDSYGVAPGPTGHGGGGGGGGGGYLPAIGEGYGGGGVYLPTTGEGYAGPSSHDSFSHGYPPPEDLYPYSAASASSDIYGPPKSSTIVHAAPLSGYEAPQAPSSGYVASQAPSSGYVAPQAPSSGYVAPQSPSSGYVAPQSPSGYVAPLVPSSAYVAPQSPSAGYVAPQAPSPYAAPQPLYDGSKSSGGNAQAVKHIHIHQHTYKIDTSDVGGVGGFGVGGGYDANLIYNSDKSFSSTSHASGREHINNKAPVVETEKNNGFSVNSLPEPQDVFIINQPSEYSAGSDGGVELIRGVREPARDERPRELGCICVPVEQCPQQLAAGSPLAREDLSAIQDPRNSPSLDGVLSNASHPTLRKRRDTQPPFDQIALPSQVDLMKQSKELFPDISRFDGDPDVITLTDTFRSNPHRVVQPSPYPNIKIVSSDLTVQAPTEGLGGSQAPSTAASFLSPTPVPVDLSVGQTDTTFVRSQREGVVQDVTQQYQNVLQSNKEVVFKDCKGVQKKVRSRRDTEEAKDNRGQSSPVSSSRWEATGPGREAGNNDGDDDTVPASPRFLGPIGDFLSNIPFGVSLKLSNVPHHSNPALSSPLHAPNRVGTSLSLGSSPSQLQVLGPSPLRLTPPHGLSPLLGPSRFPSPLTPPRRLLSPLHHPPSLSLTSPGIGTSLYPPFRHPRPLTLVDKKVGPAANLHDPTGFRHPPVHDLGMPNHGIHRPGQPSSGVYGHRERTCYYVSCRNLAYYCQVRPPPGVNCGLYEVCCSSLETYQGASSSTFNSFNSGACGIKNGDGVNGRINQLLQQEGDAEFGEYPWQAAVLKKEGYDNVYVCAATLIDERHILTAAHCVKGYEAFELSVRLGEWDVNRDTEFYPYYESDVDAVFVNPNFYSGNLVNDIAIIRIAAPVDFRRNPHIGPVCLPSYGDFTGQRCWVSGWGKNDFGLGGQYQNILKEVDLQVVSSGVCEAALQQTRLGPSYRLHPGMLCAGGQLGKDACKGDGGGPLACEGPDGNYQLAGIVSWGIGCGADGVPGVYVNVAYYLDWIYQITKY